ncbi:hypothetical protein EV421DRAFT_1748023 [Armillaria borealis]|uniref:Uncharacterized protein n=1 Tax=Armillaria borealis TaxID=47425 RepID=A0AA39IBT0_9AGAR|nr:hypothetical protein EV421DRAFT_1748023 [Armillaria borealis]
MSKWYKSAAVVDSDSDLPPVEELMTPSRGWKRAPRNLESPLNVSPSLKPVAKKAHAQDNVTPVKSMARSSTKSPVKGATRGGTTAEDIVEAKRSRTASRRAIEAAKANNLSSDEDEDDQSAAKGNSPDMTFKIGKGKTIKKPSVVAASPSEHSDSDCEQEATPPSEGIKESDIEKTPRASNAHVRAKQGISSDQDSETVSSDGGGHGSEGRPLRSKYDIKDKTAIQTPKSCHAGGKSAHRPSPVKKETPHEAKTQYSDDNVFKAKAAIGRQEVVVISTDDDDDDDNEVSKSATKNCSRAAHSPFVDSDTYYEPVHHHGRSANTDDVSIPDIKASKSSGEKTPKKKSGGRRQHEDVDSSECGEDSEPDVTSKKLKKKGKGIGFGVPELVEGDILLFGSEFSDPPNPVMAEQHADFPWACEVAPVPFAAATKYRHTLRSVLNVLENTLEHVGKMYVDALSFTHTEKIVNPSRCNPCNFALSTNHPTRPATGPGADCHVISQLTGEPIVFIFTGFLSEISRLVDPLHKNANNPHPDHTCSLTLQLLPLNENCSWSSIMFAAPCKGAVRGGGGQMNSFQCHALAQSPQKSKAKEKDWIVPVDIHSFEDGIPIYDAHKDEDFVFDSVHLDNIPNRYPLYKESNNDLPPGSFASVLYQYRLFVRGGESLSPETSPHVQLHPVMVLVYKCY